jgi:hypothetical protein
VEAEAQVEDLAARRESVLFSTGLEIDLKKLGLGMDFHLCCCGVVDGDTTFRAFE